MIGVIFHMNTAFPKLWPKKNGIYKITNRKTGRFYIGKAQGKKGFYERWSRHRLDLRKNKHCGSYLQHAYNKDGESCFTFEILELKDYGEPLRDLESEYIVNLKAMYFEDGYNLTNEKFIAKYPKIYRENHHKAKEFELLDPQGNLIKGRNIAKFCEEVGADIGHICDVLKGKSISHKGYKSPNLDFHRTREYRLLSPEKELIIFNNITEFAMKLGVTRGAVKNVLKGKHSNVQGYHLENPSSKNKKLIDRFFNKKVLINKYLGIIVKFTRIGPFALKYKVYRKQLDQFFSGKKNHLKENYNWEAPSKEDMDLYQIIEEDF